MLKEHNSIFSRINKAWDTSLTTLAFLSAYFIKKFFLPEDFQGLSKEPNYYILLLSCIIIWYLVFEGIGFYKPYRQLSFPQIVRKTIQALFLSLMSLIFLIFVFKIPDISRLFIGIFVALNFILLLSSKWFVFNLLNRLRKKGLNSKNILVIGCNKRITEILKFISLSPESGYRIIGCVTTDENDFDCSVAGMTKILGSIHDFDALANEYVIDELIFADPLRKIENVGQFIYNAELRGISIHILPEWGLSDIDFKPHIGSFKMKHLVGMPTLTLVTTPHCNPVMLFKHLFDFIIAGIGLAVCMIPFMIIAIAIRCSSRGPVFFRQERVGLNGRRFKLYKFRTMHNDAEERRQELMSLNESDGPAFKIKNDPRIIPYVGAFLRKTSLDELPQLINILKGEMSLVGPRPPLPEEVNIYDSWQRRRLSMKPGLTCIWQVEPKRNEIRFNDWVNMDLRYIDNWSLGLDFRVLCKTALVVFMGYGR